MKTKIVALAAMLLLVLSIAPVLSFEPPPTKTTKYIDPQNLEFTGPCCESKKFDAFVKIYNVKDLYAWDIWVHWDSKYLELVEYTLLVPPADPVPPSGYQVLFNESGVGWLHFAVTKLELVAGYTGDCTLAKMVFHVVYEPLWPEKITTGIWFGYEALSTACGEPIPHETEGSTIILKSSQPNVEVLFSDTFDLTKNKTQGWIKKQVIPAYVWLSNVTKLWEVNVKVGWNPHLLDIDYQQITINEEAFPQPWKILEMDISDTIITSATLHYSPTGWGGWSDKGASKLGWVLSCIVKNVGSGQGDYAKLIKWVPGASVTVGTTTYTYPTTPFGYVYDASIPETGYILQNDDDSDDLQLILEYPSALTVKIGRPNEEEKYLKGTFWLLKLDFKVKCVMNTTNTASGTGVPIDADTWIQPADGYMKMGATTYYPVPYSPYNFTLSRSRYYFTPIKYDFDQSGHVGVEDIKIILLNYGRCDTPFDFDKSGWVDIYDVVKVAKAYCNKTPPPLPDP
jgi:hypothetical protein